MKYLLNAIRLRRLNKLAQRMCDGQDCKECKAYLGPPALPTSPCAMVHVLEQALNVWGMKEEDENASKE